MKIHQNQWRRQGGAREDGRPPNVFQSVVLDSFKSDELRRGGLENCQQTVLRILRASIHRIY